MSALGDILATVNSNIDKTLDILIKEVTNIRIQTVSFDFEAHSDTTQSKSKTITSIDTNKSIIVPLSHVFDETTTSISFGFTNSSTIYCTRTINHKGYFPLNYTVAVITFSAGVIK